MIIYSRQFPLYALLLIFFTILPHFLFSQPVTLSLSLRTQRSVDFSGIDTLGSTYLSANDFARALGYPHAENEHVRKFEFRLSDHRIKITSNNPFLVITDLSNNSTTVFQLSRECFYRSGIYFVPVEDFFHLLSILLREDIRYDRSTRAFRPAPTTRISPFDITGIEIEPKLNGYLLIIKATKKLKDVEAWLKHDGWLFLTVANARADVPTINRTKPSGAIKQILTFQSPTAVQLTFRVTPDIEKAEVFNDPKSNDLLVTLHSRSAISQIDIDKKQPKDIYENLERDRDRWKLDVIVIDPGHGGKDPGTIGVSGTYEKDITLQVSKKLGNLIERNLKGVKVVYTRSNDSFVELYKRSQIANDAGGKLFISIHCNSTPSKPSNANGFEIYLLRPGKTESAISIAERENSVIRMEEGYQRRYKELTEENFILVTLQQLGFMKYSERFAEITSETIASRKRIRNSGVKQAGFYVLVGASMPNALVELGYLSNSNEEKVLKSESGQNFIAQALFEGIKTYKGIYEKGIIDFEKVGRGN